MRRQDREESKKRRQLEHCRRLGAGAWNIARVTEFVSSATEGRQGGRSCDDKGGAIHSERHRGWGCGGTITVSGRRGRLALSERAGTGTIEPHRGGQKKERQTDLANSVSACRREIRG